MSALTIATAPDRRKIETSRLGRTLHTLGVYAVLIVLCVAGAVISPKFASAGNLLNVLRNVTLLGIVCTGVAFITYSRHYVDISIPSIMAFSGMAAISAQPWGIVATVAAGLGAGLLIGAINGYVIGYWRVNPIIWTLAMVFILDGSLRWAYQGHQLYPDSATKAGDFFLNLSQWKIGGWLPLPTFIMGVVALGAYWLMSRTRFGSQVQLVGAAYEVARFSGVDCRRIVALVFMFSAFTTSLAGILLTSMNRQGTFDTGLGYDFNAVTGVVLGGMALQGGRGSIAGAIGGVLVIGVLLNLMTLIGLSSFTQMTFKGLIFVAVVAATSWFGRRTGRADV